ncbi:MAG: tetratricopeptide repeat protein [Vampirovibrionales bacterium]
MNECYYMGMSLMTLFMSLFPTSSVKAPETHSSAKAPAYLAYRCQAQDSQSQYQRSLELLFSPNKTPQYGEGFACLDASAKGGEVKAQFFLGMAFNEGIKVKDAQAHDYIPQDKVQARYWLEQSAKQGDSEAQLYLARLYQAGQGGNADGTLARYWFEKSAKQGNTDAQKELANFYLKGKNPHLAYQWFRIAEKQANKQAIALKDAPKQDKTIRLRLQELQTYLTQEERAKIDAIVASWHPQVQQQFGDVLPSKKPYSFPATESVVVAPSQAKPSMPFLNWRLNVPPVSNEKHAPTHPIDLPAS